VFGGMIAATTLNLLFIPVLYVIVKSIFPGGRTKTAAPEHSSSLPSEQLIP